MHYRAMCLVRVPGFLCLWTCVCVCVCVRVRVRHVHTGTILKRVWARLVLKTVMTFIEALKELHKVGTVPSMPQGIISLINQVLDSALSKQGLMLLDELAAVALDSFATCLHAAEWTSLGGAVKNELGLHCRAEWFLSVSQVRSTEATNQCPQSVKAKGAICKELLQLAQRQDLCKALTEAAQDMAGATLLGLIEPLACLQAARLGLGNVEMSVMRLALPQESKSLDHSREPQVTALMKEVGSRGELLLETVGLVEEVAGFSEAVLTGIAQMLGPSKQLPVWHPNDWVSAAGSFMVLARRKFVLDVAGALHAEADACKAVCPPWERLLTGTQWKDTLIRSQLLDHPGRILVPDRMEWLLQVSEVAQATCSHLASRLGASTLEEKDVLQDSLEEVGKTIQHSKTTQGVMKGLALLYEASEDCLSEMVPAYLEEIDEQVREQQDVTNSLGSTFLAP